MADWIEWHGGDCPVDPETRVQIEFCGGGTRTRKAKDCTWERLRKDGFLHGYDIARYRTKQP